MLNSLETRHRWNCNWNSYLSLSAFFQIVYPFFYLNLFSNIIMKLACQYQMIHLFWDLRQCIKTITLVLSHIYNYKILNIFASNSKDKIECVWCILLLYHDRYFLEACRKSPHTKFISIKTKDYTTVEVTRNLSKHRICTDYHHYKTCLEYVFRI